MTKKHKLPLIIIILQLIIILFASCTTIAGIISSRNKSGYGADAENAEGSDGNTPIYTYTNPLTGTETGNDTKNMRPVAIMINNIEDAQPQLGVSKADILFEAPVEGGITRMMAIYQDVSGVGTIGSIRSARPYYLDIAQGYDAIYIHAGGSEDAYNAISSYGITNLDGVNGSLTDIFYRDDERIYELGYEHSMVTSGELISTYLPTYDMEIEHRADYYAGMMFSDDGTPQDGEDASYVSVNYNNSKSTWFSYDPGSGKYLAGQYGGEYTDGYYGEQIAVRNLLVLEVETWVIDDVGRLGMDLTGSGDGYFFCGGKYIPIQWSKSSADSQFIFTTPLGGELVFGRGQSYICILPTWGSCDIS